MRAVIQRVSGCILRTEGREVSSIGAGLCVYLGVERGDREEEAELLARKLVKMRIFEDEAGRLNRSALDLKCEIMVISNFTLCADCSRGNRPSFVGAEAPERAEALYRRFADVAAESGIRVERGVFGADMKIEQHNDGPVTIVLETEKGHG